MLRRMKAMSTIIGEVILVSFAFAISLAYLGYVNSAFTQQTSNVPPNIVAEAQKNILQVLEFDHTNQSLEFTVNMVFNVKIRTLITIIGFDSNDIPVPITIDEANSFSGSSVLYPNTTLSILKLDPAKVIILQNGKYYKLSDFGVSGDVYAVEMPYNPPLTHIKATINNPSIMKARIISLTQVDTRFYEYESIETSLSTSG
ncbi:MAG: hypothetical protein F7B60_06320 [Desulfurococcales archaeon]|nr:hypothetical protein [Desulfurococcales archaeon]